MEPNFNVNRPPITDDEINSKKDFDKLLKQFKSQSIEKAKSDVNFLKNKKATYSAVIAGAAVICTVTYFSVFKKEPPKEKAHDAITTNQHQATTTKSPDRAFIAPPISKLNVPYTAYKVKAEQGASIKHKSQSKITIPKKAFVNGKGQEIAGEIEIRYREFHNQAEIIASGIPMTYDSAGIKSHFESAGMIDIRGYQNGEPVFIAPQKQIIVELASQQSADRFNMYALDTVAKNWVYLSRDNSILNQKTKELKQNNVTLSGVEAKKEYANSKTVELQKQLDAIPPKIETEKTLYTTKVNQLPKANQPAKPTKSVQGRPQFQLDVNYKDFPELAAFKNAVFEVGTENKNYNSELSNITWSSAEVSEGPDKGKNYMLTLKLRQRVEKLIVYPTLAGADYDKALKTYENKFTEYKSLVAKRQEEEKKLKEEFEAKQAAYVAEQKSLNEAMIKERIRIRQEQEQKLANEYATMGNQQKVMRVFAVSNFGIYNSDCPHSLPKEASINPIYVINNGASIVSPKTIYLVSHTKNIVYNLDYGKLSYDPKETYSLCLLANGKLYLCNKETLAHVLADKQNKIPLAEMSASVDNVIDFKKALGI